MAELRSRSPLSEAALRRALNQLQRGGRILVATGYRRVDIRLVDGLDGRAD